ncbi:MAG: hypothetical protein U0228_33010 [Myxococcaceae bacterium]
MFRTVLVSSVLAASFFACGPVDQCVRDADCKGDRVCQSGVCTSPSNLNGTGGGTGAGGGAGGGSASGGGSATGGGTGGGTAGGNGGTCCLNGSFYDCASKAAFDKCVGFNVATCHAACAPTDITCNINCDMQAGNATHDPSSCTRDTSRDNQCTLSTGDTCSDAHTEACSYSTQCSSGNCTDSYCRGNGLGARCNYSTQCTSGNCTDGCCRGNSAGSKCNYSTQCTSGNCSNGRCQ